MDEIHRAAGNADFSFCTAIGFFAVGVTAVLAVFGRFDYHAFGVLLVFIFYVCRGSRLLQNLAALVWELLMRSGWYLWCMASFVPLMLYNGRKGRGFKYFFYVFYPGHLLVLGVLQLIFKGI